MVGKLLNAARDVMATDETDPSGFGVTEYRLLRHIVRDSLLDWTRFFLKHREGTRFILSDHHRVICRFLDDVLSGKITRGIINLPPGFTKTELAVIGFISRGLALNPRARFIHASASDDLALRNSTATRDTVESEPFQKMFPGVKIRADIASKKQWTTTAGGGVYAVATGGTVIGFRAGRMESVFSGAMVIDDPIKPDDVFSDVRRERANERFNNTIRTRLANPETPIIVIMQRLHREDLSGFLLRGGSGDKWTHLNLPVEIPEHPEQYPAEYSHGIEYRHDLKPGPLWDYKIPASEIRLLKTSDSFTFQAQYMQSPAADGGGVFDVAWFQNYNKYDPKLGAVSLPDGRTVEIESKYIYSDTASKTGERNDFSVFQLWGQGRDGRIYLLDLVRGKWEFHGLTNRFIQFADRHEYERGAVAVGIRARKIEEASSGIALIQELKRMKGPSYVEGIKRDRDKVSRARSSTIHFAEARIVVPSGAIWVDDYVREFRNFSPLMTHDHDDQIDPTLDAIEDLLSKGSPASRYAALVGKGRK